MVFALHVTIDVATLSFLIGTIIPIAVALVTKQTASRGIKAAVNALLSIAAGVLSVYVSEAQGEIVSIDVAAFVTAVGAAWITSIATHYGLLKPTGITGGEGIVQSATPNLGIGSSHSHQPPAPEAGGPALDPEPAPGPVVPAPAPWATPEPEPGPQCEVAPRGVVRHRDEA
jgi:hypothetical protein